MTATEACRKGHPYTPENTRVVASGARQCRQCDKEKAQASRDAKRGDRPKFKKVKLADRCFRDHPLEGDNLYFYETKWGTQRRCRACQEIRRTERIASGVVTPPSKTHCVNGHPLEGDNLGFNPEGYARCRACGLDVTMRHKNANYDEVLDRKTRNRRKAKNTVAEAAKVRILEIYAADLSDDELIQQLRATLPPAEA